MDAPLNPSDSETPTGAEAGASVPPSDLLDSRSSHTTETRSSEAVRSTSPPLAVVRGMKNAAALRVVAEKAQASTRVAAIAAGSTDSSWRNVYRRKIVLTDTAIVLLAVSAAHVIRFGPDGGGISYGFAVERADLLSMALALCWLSALVLIQSRELTVMGSGPEEYRRVIAATGWLFGGIAAVSLFLQAGIPRGYLALALPIGLVGLLFGRRFWRRRLAASRGRGDCTSNVVVIGSRTSVESIGRRFDSARNAGYRVVGACIPGHHGSPDAVDVGGRVVPVLGNENSIDAAIDSSMADTFLVASIEQLGHTRMRDLSWRLESRKMNLVVLPGMVDIVGQRLKICPLDGFPLLHIARAKYDGAARNGKSAFDFLLAVLALVVLTPILALAAVAIKLDDGGPVFFRQERVGRRGQHFKIWKLRTMKVDAEAEISSARATAGQTSAVFYKSASDTRITSMGRFLRRTSIDEIPQLFNVLRGEMSIVGPRPLVPGEGSRVAHFVERRTLVKPGLTGLWQVSGRSDVSEEERIRLDHYYVDNWSAVQDLMIIWKTVAAVVKSDGAY